MTQLADLHVIVNHTIPFGGGGVSNSLHGILQSAYGFIVIVAGISGCFVLVVTLVVSVLMMRHRDERRRQRKYNNRMEVLKMLTTVDRGGVAGTGGEGGANGYVSSPEGTPVKIPMERGKGITLNCRSSLVDEMEGLKTSTVIQVGQLFNFLYIDNLI